MIDEIMSLFDTLEPIAPLVIIFIIAYHILTFLVPFYVIGINNKVKDLEQQIEEMQNEQDKMEELLVLMAKQTTDIHNNVIKNNSDSGAV